MSRELRVPAPIQRGKSRGARLVQEYLWVNGIKPVIDGDWGDGTQAALDAFCNAKGIPAVNSVDQQMMDLLAEPLLVAVAGMTPQATLNASVVAFARQQLAQHPIEIGGPNSGPWVRLYMEGNEGKDWLWCAGFVTYVVRYCAQIHGASNPVPPTFSCDTLAARAQKAGRFHARGKLAAIPPGSVFLVRSSASSQDFTHTGLVLTQHGATVTTAEGNTDHAGSRNGYEAASRIRNAANIDIVTL